ALYPLYIIAINYINKPINNLINKYYINDAKKILKGMPNLKIIAVTGSYGKTSTKNYLAKILSSKYNVLYTPGNFNTLLGITKTIRANLKPTHEIFICEIGIDRVRTNG
ncbi:MAG: UDP-N-acetylmuramoyl-tripeptide--D-alanyl-D-alanine ligase, partial [Clostridia bacterium]|nr:UDP-N-acetylmuramoyl-tripeptide--D-alanyl-D-alanine ligase [Clostridia bacterium]